MGRTTASIDKNLIKQAHYAYTGRITRGIPSDVKTYISEPLNITQQENNALAIIGACLHSYQMRDWETCKTGTETLATRKKTINPTIGDRYAYAIVQANDAQYDLQKRNVKDEITRIEAEIKVLDKRKTQAAKWREKHPDIIDARGRKPTKRQYNPLSYEENGHLQHLQARLMRLRANGEWYDVTFGGKSEHRIVMRALSRNDDNAEQRHHDWVRSRYNIKAIGESSKAYGNSVVRLTDTGELRIMIPEDVRQAVADTMGWNEPQKYLTLSQPVVFRYGWGVLSANLAAGGSMTNNVHFMNGAWRLITQANSDSETNRLASANAAAGGSVATPEGVKQTFATGADNPAAAARRAVREEKATQKRTVISNGINRETLATRGARFAGIDFNAGHLDVAVCDAYGNPCGKPFTVPFSMGGNEKQNRSSLLHAIDRVKHYLERRHVEAAFIEDLNGFVDSKSRVLNDGGRAFRGCVSRMPAGEFKRWLIDKLSSSSCHVELVPPAYTSKVAAAFWCDLFSSTHQGAALMVARRGLGLGLFRRVPCGPLPSCVKAMERRTAHRDESEPAVNGGSVGCGCAAAHAGGGIVAGTRQQASTQQKPSVGSSNAPSGARRRHAPSLLSTVPQQ